ncbi:hypothetical protein HZS_1462 [Henneguya salminicola]|nr:hypothetical protein HZS_1462 [Henneguya salminicola]
MQAFSSPNIVAYGNYSYRKNNTSNGTEYCVCATKRTTKCKESLKIFNAKTTLGNQNHEGN